MIFNGFFLTQAPWHGNQRQAGDPFLHSPGKDRQTAAGLLPRSSSIRTSYDLILCRRLKMQPLQGVQRSAWRLCTYLSTGRCGLHTASRNNRIKMARRRLAIGGAHPPDFLSRRSSSLRAAVAITRDTWRLRARSLTSLSDRALTKRSAFGKGVLGWVTRAFLIS